MRLAALLIAVCLLSCGCATVRYPSCYKVEGREFKEFKDLDDERALKVVCLIYNTQPASWEEKTARSIALEQYINLLAKRRSKYVSDSGIFQVQYEKVRLSRWKDGDLVRLQESLAPKTAYYYADAAPELTEAQNSQRIILVTALEVVVNELKKRSNTQEAMSVAGQLLAGALSIALAMI